MSDRKREFARLQQLETLQKLRQDAASMRLASAQKATNNAVKALDVAQEEEEAMRNRLNTLLNADRFDCGTYTLRLGILAAQSKNTQVKRDLAENAKGAEQDTRAEHSLMDAGTQNLRRAVCRQRKKLQRKDEDRREAQHLDQYNSQHEAPAL